MMIYDEKNVGFVGRPKKGDPLTITDINEEQHTGTFLRIEDAVWRPKRKSEPTLVMDSTDSLGKDVQLAIPTRNIKEEI